MAEEKLKEIDEVSKTLNIKLPDGQRFLPIKIIAFLTAIGGLSVVGSLFADIVRPTQISLFLYVFRACVGVLMILIGYGILKKKGWAVWLYGGISLISFFINPTLAFLPICITIYLYTKRHLFKQVDAKSIANEINDELKKLDL